MNRIEHELSQSEAEQHQQFLPKRKFLSCLFQRWLDETDDRQPNDRQHWPLEVVQCVFDYATVLSCERDTMEFVETYFAQCFADSLLKGSKIFHFYLFDGKKTKNSLLNLQKQKQLKRIDTDFMVLIFGYIKNCISRLKFSKNGGTEVFKSSQKTWILRASILFFLDRIHLDYLQYFLSDVDVYERFKTVFNDVAHGKMEGSANAFLMRCRQLKSNQLSPKDLAELTKQLTRRGWKETLADKQLLLSNVKDSSSSSVSRVQFTSFRFELSFDEIKWNQQVENEFEAVVEQCSWNRTRLSFIETQRKHFISLPQQWCRIQKSPYFFCDEMFALYLQKEPQSHWKELSEAVTKSMISTGALESYWHCNNEYERFLSQETTKPLLANLEKAKESFLQFVKERNNRYVNEMNSYDGKKPKKRRENKNGKQTQNLQITKATTTPSFSNNAFAALCHEEEEEEKEKKDEEEKQCKESKKLCIEMEFGGLRYNSYPKLMVHQNFTILIQPSLKEFYDACDTFLVGSFLAFLTQHYNALENNLVEWFPDLSYFKPNAQDDADEKLNFEVNALPLGVINSHRDDYQELSRCNDWLKSAVRHQTQLQKVKNEFIQRQKADRFRTLSTQSFSV
jgi:hypothetical protein